MKFLPFTRAFYIKSKAKSIRQSRAKIRNKIIFVSELKLDFIKFKLPDLVFNLAFAL